MSLNVRTNILSFDHVAVYHKPRYRSPSDISKTRSSPLRCGLSDDLSNTRLAPLCYFCLVITHITTVSLHRQKETAAGENSHAAGGDAAEQPRQPTNHRETMTDLPGRLTEHQSNWALLALHSCALSSCLHSATKQCSFHLYHTWF